MSTASPWGHREKPFTAISADSMVLPAPSHAAARCSPVHWQISTCDVFVYTGMVDFLVMPSLLPMSPSIRTGKKPFSSPKAIHRLAHSPHPQLRKPISLPLVHIRRQREEIPLVHYSLQSNRLETLLSAKAKSLRFDDRITIQTAIARSLYWHLYPLISVCHFLITKVAHACLYLDRPCIFV